MKKGWIFCVFTLILSGRIVAQKAFSDKHYRASVQREDGRLVVFDLELKDSLGHWKGFIKNAKEKIEIDDIKVSGDSLWMEMPVFESKFSAAFMRDGSITGKWTKGTALATGYQDYSFLALPGQPRFTITDTKPATSLSGRWAVTLVRPNGTERPAVAEFKQNGHHITGTILTPNSDYRYLEGVVNGDSLYLSTFDGAHSYLFLAKIASDSILTGGHFYAGFRGDEAFTAAKNEQANVQLDLSAVYLKNGTDSFSFRFPDLNGKMVSIRDKRYANKVVVVQLMGSWCPNCMDETAFLSPWYNANKNRGVEILALAYENSTDFMRSQKSLRKFQKRFSVQYPMLITGVSVSDSLRTEKTLPQITPIKAFPTSLFIDKKGRVRQISTGFFGPGTGQHYKDYIREFNQRVDELLKE